MLSQWRSVSRGPGHWKSQLVLELPEGLTVVTLVSLTAEAVVVHVRAPEYAWTESLVPGGAGTALGPLTMSAGRTDVARRKAQLLFDNPRRISIRRREAYLEKETHP